MMMNSKFEQTRERKRIHLPATERSTIVNYKLTIFAWDEIRIRRVAWGEEEHSTVRCHQESYKRDDLETVDSEILVRANADGEKDGSDQNRSKDQRLEHGALHCEKYRDKGNEQLAKSNWSLPVVGSRRVAIVKEPKLFFQDFGVEIFAFTVEKIEREKRGPNWP